MAAQQDSLTARRGQQESALHVMRHDVDGAGAAQQVADGLPLRIDQEIADRFGRRLYQPVRLALVIRPGNAADAGEEADCENGGKRVTKQCTAGGLARR